MGSIKQNTKKSLKDLAKQAAKQAAQEPYEVAKTAGSQVTGAEKKEGERPQEPMNLVEGNAQVTEEEKQAKEAQRRKLMQDLEEELEKVSEEEEAKRLQEEKEEEAEKMAKEKEKEEKEKETADVRGKQPRGVLKGMRGKIRKLRKKSEIRMPPSG
jgi:hypothetical protein